MQRRQRQKRQRQRGQRHRQHVAEVGARPHAHILHDVGVGAPALRDAVGERAEIGRKHDDVGRLTRHVRSAIDRNPDIGHVNGRGVVDAVAEEADRMAATAQGAHDAAFLLRRDPHEQVGRLHAGRQRRVGEFCDIVAGDQAARRQCKRLDQMPHHRRGVARYHLDPHAGRAQPLDGGRDRRLGRIDEAGAADEREIRLVGWRDPGAIGSHRPARDAEEAQALAALGVEQRVDPRPRGGVERHHPAVRQFGTRAQRQQRLRRALGQQLALALVLHQHRQAAAIEIERNVVDASIGAVVRLPDGEQRIVEIAARAAGKPAVEASQLRGARAVGAVDAKTASVNDPAFRQRSGLVGAQHLHGAEVMDSRESLDHDPARGHPHGAARQGDGHDHRQKFRRESDGQRHREQKTLQRQAVAQQLREKHEQHQKPGQPQDQHAERLHPALESGRRGFLLDQARDLAKARRGAGRHHQHGRLTADETGAAEQGIEGIGRHRALDRAGLLLGRVRLAGQDRLVDERGMARQHHSVGRHEVAAAQFDHVTRHDIADRPLDEPSVTADRGGHRHRTPQRIDGRLRLLLLNDIEHDRESDDYDDDDEAVPVAHHPGDRRRNQQNGNERLGDALCKPGDEATPNPAHREVRPVASKASVGLAPGQTVWPGVQSLQKRIIAFGPECASLFARTHDAACRAYARAGRPDQFAEIRADLA